MPEIIVKIMWDDKKTDCNGVEELTEALDDGFGGDKHFTVSELPPVDGKVDVKKEWNNFMKNRKDWPGNDKPILLIFFDRIQILIDTLQRRCEEEYRRGVKIGKREGYSAGIDMAHGRIL